MLESYIIWNGVSSEEFENLLIKKVPSLDRPRRKREVYQVPGRNGDVIISQDAYEDYDQEYQLFLYAEEKGEELAQRCAEIADWLYAPVGAYASFVDSYDPDYTRYAYVSEEVEIESELAKFGTVKIPFRFRPERFLNTGLSAVKYTSTPIQLGNPTQYKAKPLIYLEANSSVLMNATLTINDTVVTISELVDEMYIDCETMNAYKGTTNLNNKISITGGEFPVLKPGQNTVSWSGRIGSVTITPRWWKI